VALSGEFRYQPSLFVHLLLAVRRRGSHRRLGREEAGNFRSYILVDELLMRVAVGRGLPCWRLLSPSRKTQSVRGCPDYLPTQVALPGGATGRRAGPRRAGRPSRCSAALVDDIKLSFGSQDGVASQRENKAVP
jgi:hypothetical protein